MELVPYSTKQLEYLANDDPQLKLVFQGVFAADQLPSKPEFTKPCAYIVNADPISKPGSHWFGMFTEQGKCEIMDSYGMPLNWYGESPFTLWVFDKWQSVTSNAKSLQELKSNACGQYALMYLKFRARGKSLEDFTKLFAKGKFVENDHKVGDMLKKEIRHSLEHLSLLPHQQCNFKSCHIDI